MLIKFIVAHDDKFQIETFDIDMEKNRIWKIDSNNRGSYLRGINELILRDISRRRIVPE